MVHLHKKIKGKGKHSYWYLRQTKWVDGKSKVVWQKYLGTAEKIKQMYQRQQALDHLKLHSFEYGGTAALLDANEDLNFVELVNKHVNKKKGKLTTGEYLLLIILGRADGPWSKAKTAKWFGDSLLSLIWSFPHQLNSQNFLHHMTHLDEDAMRMIEEGLARNLLVRGLSPAKLILNLDTTNFFTYIERGEELPRKGHSKEHRSDKNLVSLGLVVTRENIPLLHEVYPGNVHDAKVFPRLLDLLVERLKILGVAGQDVVLVFDKGNNSVGNIERVLSDMHVVGSLKRNQVRELLGVPVEQYSYLYENKKGHQVLGLRRRLEVFGCHFTVVIAYHAASYERQRRSYEANKSKIRKKLEGIKEKCERGKRKRRGRKLSRNGLVNAATDAIVRPLRSIFKFKCEVKEAEATGEGKEELDFNYWIDETAEARLYQSFGKVGVFTDLHRWSSKKIVQTYHSKHRVEQDFKWLNDVFILPVRPVFHRKDLSVRVHLFLCVIGLLFYGYLAWKVKRLGLSMREMVEELKKIRVAAVQDKSTKKTQLVFEEMSVKQARLFSTLDLGRFIEA